MEQTSFIQDKNFFKGFGGTLLKKANAREARPVSDKHAIHVVMRSEIAKGELSMRKKRNLEKVEEIVRGQAEKWGMKIYKYANVGNHLHILLRPHSKKRFAGYLRSITGLIARHVLQVGRGRAKNIRFWQARPFTRVVKWGKAFVKAKEYVELNFKEALGFLSERKMRQYGLSPETG